MADLEDLTETVLTLIDDGRGVLLELPGASPDRQAAAAVLERVRAVAGVLDERLIARLHGLATTGHRDLQLSDVGWWSCRACGRKGDAWINPADELCEPA